jgi:thymidylate synthase (FAD)
MSRPIELKRLGFPKELARTHLTVSRYSRMRASTDLRNWLRFLTLRTAPNAQEEIRTYAVAVEKLVKEAFPRTYELFVEGRSQRSQ